MSHYCSSKGEAVSGLINASFEVFTKKEKEFVPGWYVIAQMNYENTGNSILIGPFKNYEEANEALAYFESYSFWCPWWNPWPITP